MTNEILTEVKTLQEKVLNLDHLYKQKADEFHNEIKKTGEASAVTKSQLENLDKEIEQLKSLIKDATRPQLPTDKKGNAITTEVKEYNNALNSYIRKGHGEEALKSLEKKAMSVFNDADGGFLVTPEMGGIIQTQVFETTPMRQLANVINISTESVEFITDGDEAGYEWVAEVSARNTTDTPQLGKITIQAHELSFKPKVSQKLLDDASVNVEAWLAGKIADAAARAENSAFVNGDGNGKPKGILSYGKTTSTIYTNDSLQYVFSGTNGSIGTNADKIMDLIYALKGAYRNNAVMLTNRGVVSQLRKMKLTDKYLWSESLIAGQPATFAGYRVIEGEDVPAAGTDSYSIIFGDFNRGYQIVDRVGIRILRDPFSAKPNVEFYTTKRVGGGIINFEALKLLKLGTS